MHNCYEFQKPQRELPLVKDLKLLFFELIADDLDNSFKVGLALKVLRNRLVRLRFAKPR
jgi:hypothetical protein